MKSQAITIAAAVALAALAMPAKAEILAAKARTDAFNVPDGGVVPVPLDNKGNLSAEFKTSKKGMVVITYNAECAAEGSAGDWLGLEIRVNGKLINPKVGADEFAFCTASGADEVYTAVSRQGFVKLDPGEHTVQVLVSKPFAGTGRIDDGAIIVED